MNCDYNINLVFQENQKEIILLGIEEMYKFLSTHEGKNNISKAMFNYQILKMKKLMKEIKNSINTEDLRVDFKISKMICEGVYYLKYNLNLFNEEALEIIDIIKEAKGYDFWGMKEKCEKGKLGKADVGEDAFSIIGERNDFAQKRS